MVTQTSWTMSVHPASRSTAASTTHTCLPGGGGVSSDFSKARISFLNWQKLRKHNLKKQLYRTDKKKKTHTKANPNITRHRLINSYHLLLPVWFSPSPGVQSQAIRCLWELVSAPEWSKPSLLDIRQDTMLSKSAAIQSAPVLLPCVQKPFFLTHVCWWFHLHLWGLKWESSHDHKAVKTI